MGDHVKSGYLTYRYTGENPPPNVMEIETNKNQTVVIVDEDDHFEVKAIDVDLSWFVDAIPVDAVNFDEYHDLRARLRTNAVR